MIRRAVLLLGAALAACAPMVPPAETPAVLATRLPEMAAEFQRGATATLPEGGTETAYGTRGRLAAAATIALLPIAGEERPPEGAGSPQVRDALDQLLDDATRAGPHRMMAEAGRLSLPAGGAEPGLLCAATAGRYGRERVRGLLCAGIVSGRMLRLRVAMPAREPPPADAQAFAEAVLAALRAPARR